MGRLGSAIHGSAQFWKAIPRRFANDSVVVRKVECLGNAANINVSLLQALPV